MSSTIETLRRMACDIARNFEAMADANPALATATHIRKFWDPRMRELIIADDRSKLIPIAREAIEHLAKVDSVGHADAG
jgi:formate dehydrogenase subunit delta